MLVVFKTGIKISLIFFRFNKIIWSKTLIFADRNDKFDGESVIFLSLSGYYGSPSRMNFQMWKVV